MYAYVYSYYPHIYKYAYIYEMNDINDTRDRKEELGLLCYCEVLTLPIT